MRMRIKKPRLTNTINSKKLEELVRFEIETYFYIKHLTDRRLGRLINEKGKDVMPSLKEEAYSIFEQSFNKILSNLEVSRSRTPIIATWYNATHVIEKHEQYGNEIEYDQRKDIKLNLRLVYLRFDKYYMCLQERIFLICKHVMFKKMWADMFELAQYARPLSEEEKKTRNGFTPIDTYPFVKQVVRDANMSQDYDIEMILKPQLTKDKEDGTIRIGSSGWSL